MQEINGTKTGLRRNKLHRRVLVFCALVFATFIFIQKKLSPGNNAVIKKRSPRFYEI